VSKKGPGDHLHALAYGADHRLEQITDFDFDEIDRNLSGEETEDEQVAWGDMAAAFALVLQHICGDRIGVTDVRIVAGRALSLLLWLAPDQCDYDSMADIAKACGCTRAALSKSLIRLRDDTGCFLSAGKGFHTRAQYSEAQRRAVEAGTHSSQSRADRKP
jgi:biotin operon repressor